MDNIIAKIKALPFFDKILHVAGGFVAAAFVTLLYYVEANVFPGMLMHPFETSLLNSVIAVAAAKEAQDYIDQKNGLPHSASPLDFLATVGGGVVAIIALKLFA